MCRHKTEFMSAHVFKAKFSLWKNAWNNSKHIYAFARWDWEQKQSSTFTINLCLWLVRKVGPLGVVVTRPHLFSKSQFQNVLPFVPRPARERRDAYDLRLLLRRWLNVRAAYAVAIRVYSLNSSINLPLHVIKHCLYYYRSRHNTLTFELIVWLMIVQSFPVAFPGVCYELLLSLA